MGVLIKWKIPTDSNVTAVYTLTEIHRASSEAGAYSLLTSQSLSDNSYFDQDGTTANWYKVRFKNAGGTVFSDYSDPIQGGNFEFYCTPDDVRTVSGITTSQLSDAQLYDLIAMATAEVNRDIAMRVDDEFVTTIVEDLFYGKSRYGGDIKFHTDSIEKKNILNSTNTTFYTKNYPICDRNNDGVVDGNDFEAYVIDSTGTRTEITVSAVDDPRIGKFTTSTAPGAISGIVGFFLTYNWSFIDVYPNRDPVVTKLCALKTAGMAYQRLENGQYGSWRVGKVAATKSRPTREIIEQDYNNTLNKLRKNPIRVQSLKRLV